jgi:hypothetical protein
MKSLNRYYARLHGIAITETPLITIERHENENTQLDLGNFSIETQAIDMFVGSPSETEPTF